MVYVALLRGINVGGNARVEMVRLKMLFETLGFSNVSTYINSGNVIFTDDTQSEKELVSKIEAAINKEFGLGVPVVVRSFESIKKINAAIPARWVNDGTMKTDVMFLWDAFDSAKTLEMLTIRPSIDDVRYFPGVIVWRVDKANVTRSGLLRIVGTELYRNMTIRNINTLRKLHQLMKDAHAL